MQHFAATMQVLGYAGLHFWGYKHITYGMEAADGQWADLYGEDPTLKFAGDLASSKAGANYGKARANRASMSGFGPGLKAPFTRSYDF